MAELVITEAKVMREGRAVLDCASLSLCPGELVALVGPNGAGKTTLLRAALGLIKLDGGEVRLSGQDPRTLSSVARARTIAYLPQARPLAWPLRVEDVVALGRFAWGGPLQRPGGADATAVARALAACELETLVGRSTDTLSGGELARVHIARALASETALLIADEPTAALDPRHAYETLAILKRYCAAGGGALVTLHDLSLAARFSDRVVLLHEGRVLADDSPDRALSPDRLASAFGVRARLVDGAILIDGPVSALPAPLPQNA